jgi:hypothetical protein
VARPVSGHAALLIVVVLAVGFAVIVVPAAFFAFLLF